MPSGDLSYAAPDVRRDVAATMEYPERFPVHYRMLVSADGHLWLERVRVHALGSRRKGHPSSGANTRPSRYSRPGGDEPSTIRNRVVSWGDVGEASMNDHM